MITVTPFIGGLPDLDMIYKDGEIIGLVRVDHRGGYFWEWDRAKKTTTKCRYATNDELKQFYRPKKVRQIELFEEEMR